MRLSTIPANGRTTLLPGRNKLQIRMGIGFYRSYRLRTRDMAPPPSSSTRARRPSWKQQQCAEATGCGIDSDSGCHGLPAVPKTSAAPALVRSPMVTTPSRTSNNSAQTLQRAGWRFFQTNPQGGGLLRQSQIHLVFAWRMDSVDQPILKLNPNRIQTVEAPEARVDRNIRVKAADYDAARVAYRIAQEIFAWFETQPDRIPYADNEQRVILADTFGH